MGCCVLHLSNWKIGELKCLHMSYLRLIRYPELRLCINLLFGNGIVFHPLFLSPSYMSTTFAQKISVRKETNEKQQKPTKTNKIDSRQKVNSEAFSPAVYNGCPYYPAALYRFILGIKCYRCLPLSDIVEYITDCCHRLTVQRETGVPYW